MPPRASEDPGDPELRRAALLRGQQAERDVADWLEGQGWQVLARNWHGRGGELDLVVLRDAKLRIVEVKLRRPDDPVGLEAISASKQRKLRRTAEAWLEQHEDLYLEVAFAVAYVVDGAIDWIDDAF